MKLAHVVHPWCQTCISVIALLQGVEISRTRGNYSLSFQSPATNGSQTTNMRIKRSPEKTHLLLLLAEEEDVDPALAWRFCRARMRVSIESARTSFVTCASDTESCHARVRTMNKTQWCYNVPGTYSSIRQTEAFEDDQ